VGARVAVATFTAFGNGVIRPVLTSLITQRAGRHEQGVVLGLNGSMCSGAMITAPVVAGTLIGHQWLTPWAWVGALAAGIGLWLARLGSRQTAAPTVSHSL
jgi:MFS family permease